MLASVVREHLTTSSRVIGSITAQSDRIVEASRILADSLSAGHKILWCGNGGSAGQAQHLNTELVVRLAPTRERRALASVALSADTSLLTACANDYGYEQVFSRQIEALGASGDVLIGLSTSGNSPNVIRAFQSARKLGMHTVALAGEGGGKLRSLATIAVCVPATACYHIQESHLAIGHLLCDLVERRLFDRAE